MVFFFSFLQDNSVEITGTRQKWSEDACGRSGISYQVKIRSEEFMMKNVAVERIYLDGYCFSDGFKLHVSDHLLSIDVVKTFRDGIEEDNATTDTGNRIHLLIDGVKKEIPFGGLTDLPFPACP